LRSLAEAGVSFMRVPMAPIAFALSIFTAANIDELIVFAIALVISINAAVVTVMSVLKYNNRKLWRFAHISLIVYWGLSLAILVIFK
jgi:hypothetical protein